MGVLACSREGCESIMCDRYSRTHGYICDYCFRELVSKGFTTNITTFMETYKDSSRIDEDVSFIYFDKEFPN